MITEYLRDHAFTIAWFGLMTFVWFGWAQEAPPQTRRWKLGVGSMLGLAFAGAFGASVVMNWGQGSALDGNFHWYGLIVGIEVLVALAGAIYLSRSGRGRWMAWWVAMVVAVHFIALAFLMSDVSQAVLGVLQAAGLLVLRHRLIGKDYPSSRDVGPFMGVTFLTFSVISAVVFLATRGTPW